MPHPTRSHPPLPVRSPKTKPPTRSAIQPPTRPVIQPPPPPPLSPPIPPHSTPPSHAHPPPGRSHHRHRSSISHAPHSPLLPTQSPLQSLLPTHHTDRNIQSVVLGDAKFDTWFHSLYPEELVPGKGQVDGLGINGSGPFEERRGVNIGRGRAGRKDERILYVCQWCFRYCGSWEGEGPSGEGGMGAHVVSFLSYIESRFKSPIIHPYLYSRRTYQLNNSFPPEHLRIKVQPPRHQNLHPQLLRDLGSRRPRTQALLPEPLSLRQALPRPQVCLL